MMNGALDDMIAALDARNAAYDAAPAWLPTNNLPSTGDGIRGLFQDISQLVRIGYEGQALVQQQKFMNRIAEARLENQLETVRTTPNLWLVLGLGAAGLVVLQLADRRR